MTTQCCKCRKVKSRDGWNHDYLHTDAIITFSYCPQCLAAARADLAPPHLEPLEFVPVEEIDLHPAVG